MGRSGAGRRMAGYRWTLRRSALVSRVSSRVTALILGDIGIARLGGNLFPLTFQNEINGRDFIRGLDRIVRNMYTGRSAGNGGLGCIALGGSNDECDAAQ
jgi:hypothetical protein